MTDYELFNVAVRVIEELLEDEDLEECPSCWRFSPKHNEDCYIGNGLSKLKNRRDELYRESLK